MDNYSNTLFVSENPKLTITGVIPNTEKFIINSNKISEFDATTDASNMLPWNIVKISNKTRNISISNDNETDSFTKNNTSFTKQKNLSDNSASYALLRTNPKLTGNVKVVIDSNDSIFIDTFKVNDTLAKRKYHKVPVSYNDYYGKNLMSIFNKISSSDFYNIPGKYNELFTVTSNWENQYATIYESGAQINQDKLYSENFSLFAPIYINDILPDFFVIFKVDDTEKNTLADLIKKGKQIATYNFQEGTKLGTYIRNIQKNANLYNDGIFISSPTIKNENNTNLADSYLKNIITGISIDKGVVAQKYESAQQNPATNDTWNSYYFTNLYREHRLVSPRIINFEFMFDDNTSKTSQFEVNTYFGVYVYVNKEINDIHISTTKNYWENLPVSGSSNSITPSKDNIDALSSDNWFERVTDQNELMNALNSKETEVGKNLLYINAKSLDSEYGNISSFLTLTLNNKIKAGEQYKFILMPNGIKASNISIYEILFTNASAHEKCQISDVYKNIYSHAFNTETREITSYRICCYVNETDTIENQILNIKKILLKFDNSPFRITYTTNNTICICCEDASINPEFQRLSSEYAAEINGEIDEDKLTQYIGRKDITFFDNVNVDEFIINPLNIEDPSYGSYEYSAYIPMHYEILGARLSLNINFISTNTTDSAFNILNVQLNAQSMVENGDLLYNNLVAKSADLQNKHIGLNKFQIISKKKENGKILNNITSINLISSYTGKNIKLMQLNSNEAFPKKPNVIKLGIYLPYYINYGTCGIMPIYDFNFIFPVVNDINHQDFYTINLSTDASTIIVSSTIYDDPFIQDTIYNEGQRYSDISVNIPENIKWVSYSHKNIELKYNGNIYNGKPTEESSYPQIEFDKEKKQYLLNGEISISDIVAENTSKKEKIKIYKTQKNTLEFVYLGNRYEISLNDTNIISEDDIANMHLYFYICKGFPDSNIYDIFVSKKENAILIIYYNLANDDTQIIKLDDGNEKIHYLNIPGATLEDIKVTKEKDKEPILSIKKKNLNNKSKKYLIYSNNYTLYYDPSSPTSMKISYKHGFKNDITISDNILDYIPGNDKIEVYEILDKNDKFDNYADKPEEAKVSTYIKSGELEYSDYSNANILSIKCTNTENNENYFTYFYPKLDNVITFKNNYNTNYDNETTIKREIKKYSDLSNFCFEDDSSSKPNNYSFDVIDSSIFQSPLSEKIFRNYTKKDSEIKIKEYSARDTGILIKNFYNSPCLLLKNKYQKEIIINTWNEVFVSNKKIYFNVSKSLLSKISNSAGINKLFNSANDKKSKQSFIRATILPKIHLSINDTITIYQKNYNGGMYASTYSEDMTIAKNTKAELIQRNGSYYVELTPTDTAKTYYITYLNKLA